MAQFVVRPGIEQSTNWNKDKHEAPPEVIAMVEAGNLPNQGRKYREHWKKIAKTPLLRMAGLKQYLGKLQQQLQLSEATKDLLDDGKLHLWHFLEFNKPGHIPFPEDPMPQIEEIESGAMQSNAHGGYKLLVESTILWLKKVGPDGGVEKFFIPTVRLEGESVEAFNSRVNVNRNQARDNRRKEISALTGIVECMKMNSERS